DGTQRRTRRPPRRCIGHYPVPRSASLRRPAAGLGRHAGRLDQHGALLTPPGRDAAPVLPLTIDHRPRPNWVAALRPASSQVTGAIYGCGTSEPARYATADIIRYKRWPPEATV